MCAYSSDIHSREASLTSLSLRIFLHAKCCVCSHCCFQAGTELITSPLWPLELLGLNCQTLGGMLPRRRRRRRRRARAALNSSAYVRTSERLKGGRAQKREWGRGGGMPPRPRYRAPTSWPRPPLSPFRTGCCYYYALTTDGGGLLPQRKLLGGECLPTAICLLFHRCKFDVSSPRTRSKPGRERNAWGSFVRRSIRARAPSRRSLLLESALVLTLLAQARNEYPGEAGRLLSQPRPTKASSSEAFLRNIRYRPRSSPSRPSASLPTECRCRKGA